MEVVYAMLTAVKLFESESALHAIWEKLLCVTGSLGHIILLIHPNNK